MNGDASDSVLNSHICFNALATLQHLKNVENCKYNPIPFVSFYCFFTKWTADGQPFFCLSEKMVTVNGRVSFTDGEKENHRFSFGNHLCERYIKCRFDTERLRLGFSSPLFSTSSSSPYVHAHTVAPGTPTPKRIYAFHSIRAHGLAHPFHKSERRG